MSKTQEVRFRSAIRKEDPTATEADIRKRLKKATKKAFEEADIQLLFAFLRQLSVPTVSTCRAR